MFPRHNARFRIGKRNFSTDDYFIILYYIAFDVFFLPKSKVHSL